MSGDDRRRQLIEIAIDLFSRKGFAGTTTKEIAAAAGVTEAIIFRHFATKQDLYKAILDFKSGEQGSENWLTQAEALMDANDDLGLFRFLLSGIIGSYRKYPQIERLLIHAALEGHELAIMHQQQVALKIGATFSAYIARRQAAGAFRPCDPLAVLFSVAGLAKFYAMQKYMFRFCEMPMQDEEIIEQFLTILMNGLQTK